MEEKEPDLEMQCGAVEVDADTGSHRDRRSPGDCQRLEPESLRETAPREKGTVLFPSFLGLSKNGLVCCIEGLLTSRNLSLYFATV